MVSQTVAGVKTLGTGEVSEELDSYPFGEERITTKNATFDTPRKFTGKETDEELGLIYFGARYYDSRIGRFISLDPSTLMLNDPRSFVNPQGFNFYSYVMNNPVRYVDPDGRDWVDNMNTSTAFMYEFVDTYSFDILPDVPAITEASQRGARAGIVAADSAAKTEMIAGATATIYGSGMAGGGLAGGLATCAATAGGGCVVGGAATAGGLGIAAAGMAMTAHGASTHDLAGKKLKELESQKKDQIKSLEKSNKSLAERIREHYEKIQNPLKFINDPASIEQYKTNINYRNGIVKHWQKEIEVFQNQITKNKESIIKLSNN